MEIKQAAIAGDMAYLYPDNPKFTTPTRWFRYEAIAAFHDSPSGQYVIARPPLYTGTAAQQLSEITLYAKKKR
jgi:hypothetical protein